MNKPTMTSVGMRKWRANTARKEAAVMSQCEAMSLKKDWKKLIMETDMIRFWRRGLASQASNKDKSKGA